MANANTMTKISTVTVGSGGAASIAFTSIPATYTDIVIKYSARSTATGDNWQNVNVKINTDTGSNYTSKLLYGNGSAAGSDTSTTTFLKFMYAVFADATASVFGNGELYFAKYAGSIYKSMIADTVTENNATGSGSSIIGLTTGLWSDNSAINAITLTPNSGSWAEHSTATLYGIKATTATTALATGGDAITYNGGYVYHTFLNSGTFTPSKSLVADCLVIAGGGSAGYNTSGGGGAGGLVYLPSTSFTATGYAVTVGAGGATASSVGNQGSDSQVGSLTLVKGGGYGGTNGGAAATGGSGGGNSFTAGSGGNGTAGQGNAGGGKSGANYVTGGGGGAGAVGGDGSGTVSGNGGVGSSAYSSWGYATTTGHLVSGIYYYAGGGGGSGFSSFTPGSGGSGGGGVAGNTSTAGTAATANTGGGGGGGGSNQYGGAGGKGIIIIRYQVQ